VLSVTVTQDTTSNNVNDVSTSAAVSDAVVISPNLSQSNQSVCDQSIVDQSISNKSVNDKSVLTESTVCDDDKVNDDGIKSPDETTCLASSNEIAKEQRHDKSLAACFKLAERGRGGFVVKNNLLYHCTKYLFNHFCN